MRKLYKFYCDSTNQKYSECLTAKEATEVCSILNYSSQQLWLYTTNIEEMLKYNSTIQNVDYITEVKKFSEVYSGTNLRMKVDKIHSMLKIRPLEGREIFEPFKL